LVKRRKHETERQRDRETERQRERPNIQMIATNYPIDPRTKNARNKTG